MEVMHWKERIEVRKYIFAFTRVWNFWPKLKPDKQETEPYNFVE